MYVGKFLGFEFLQGNDRFLEIAFRRLMGLKKEGIYPCGIGNLSGAANVLPLAQIRHILYAAVADGYDELAREISAYVNEDALRVLTDKGGFPGLGKHGGRGEPRIWKAMVRSYLPNVPLGVLNPEIAPLSPEQINLLQEAVRAIENKRDYFLARYQNCRALALHQ